MTVLITGVAGFIGFHTAKTLLEQGTRVIGVDNLNDYYDPRLKEDRLAQLKEVGGEAFHLHLHSIADYQAMTEVTRKHEEHITHIIHLAAQAGVRYSLENPFAYGESNLTGQLAMLEIARRLPELKQFVYASSSSVYGNQEKTPFSVEDRTDHPVSLYAATKKAGELMAESYVNLYKIPAVGLRFFTVYGPWGRPDMAYFSFTKAILEGKPIRVFNHGRQQRDFTYIDDIVSGILACLELKRSPAHRIYNLGNHRPVELMHFIRTIETLVGKPAELIMEEAQKGDVERTYADISLSRRDLGFEPSTRIEDGLARFVAWYREYYGA